MTQVRSDEVGRISFKYWLQCILKLESGFAGISELPLTSVKWTVDDENPDLALRVYSVKYFLGCEYKYLFY